MTLEASPSLSSAAESALAELGAITRLSVDLKRQSFVKLFKQLSKQDRGVVCERAASLLHEKFSRDESPQIGGILYALTGGIALERDWESALKLLHGLVHSSSDGGFYRELSIILLEIADNELESKHAKIPLGQTSLVFLTELGLLLANREGKTALGGKGIGDVVEYITTNLLARSNVNSNAMRIALVHFLSRCQGNSQGTMQLGRVISRFGQSLLEDMFLAMFEDKKRENAAFYFLLSHLDSFFTASPALADMGKTVLRHYMLKYPAEFPGFLSNYVEKLPRDSARLRMASRYLGFLLRAATDVSQRVLTENIVKVLGRHLESFSENTELLEAEVGIVTQNLMSGSAKRNELVDEVMQTLNAVLKKARNGDSNFQSAAKALSKHRIKKAKEIGIRTVKPGTAPSPLESMLQLVC